MLNSLQSRILALFLLMMVVVQVGGFVLINTVGVAAARKTIGEDLVAGARVFDRLLEQDTQRLVQGARLMSADYAFREVIATGDRETIASVLANYSKRMNAAVMMAVGLDQRVTGDTLGVATGRPFPFPSLLAQARTTQQAAGMAVIAGHLYQLVVVPVLAPVPIAWVAIGYTVDDELSQDLRRLTRLNVSFFTQQPGGDWQLQASTLAQSERRGLSRDMLADRFAERDANGNAVNVDEALTRVIALPARADVEVVAVLQEPLSSALEPFRRLQRQLTLISFAGVIISFFASVLMARSIARPVRDLASVARRIAAGDYSTTPAKSKLVEISDLAGAFRSMQAGIASRESRIMDLAYRDPLTELPNRALYQDLLDGAIADAAPAQKRVAVLLMDLDHFKDVNDTLGHPIGDLLLRAVGARLEQVLDRPRDTVARLGGDEFAIVLPGEGADEAMRVAKAILSALEMPMTPNGHVVDVHASIGIAIYPEHGNERSTLMRRADVAMYAAKRNHLGVVLWDDRYEEHSSERLSLMSDLRKAVDEDQLMLVYQPKVTLRGSPEYSAEALVRWRHPTRGLVAPAEFIPFAEQTGYIKSITNWVLEKAVAQCAAWRDAGLPMNISINISARDLMDPELPDRFAAILNKHGCAAHWIALELTESAVLDDPAHAIHNLERLNGLGCKLAIDDYGTGYSSLAYLRRLPVHELKIDKSFVMSMAGDASDALIVRSTIDLAHNMGLRVVAEGVEDEATLERLRSIGCDLVQGFLLSRPLGAGELAVWMRGSVWARNTRETTGLRRVV
jgi:diguanylate cyclase (GGDEF)-like protein